MKKTLRTQIGRTLRALAPAQLSLQGDITAEALRQLPEYCRASKIAFYMHMDTGELPTNKMIEHAFQDGKRVFLPHIVPWAASESHPWFPSQKTHLCMLEMPSLEAVEALEPRGKYKLKEPLEGKNCLDDGGIDLIVEPGVGFGAEGSRLGHGAGFYDSFVSEHEAVTGRKPILVGVGLSEQLATVPMAEHDRKLDRIVLGGEVLK